MAINMVTLVGRLTKDPAVRKVGNDLSVCSFTLAVDNKGKDKGTSFIDCTAWGKQAEVLEKYVHKGQLLAVDGRLRQEVWEKDDKKNSRISVVIDDFMFLSPKDNNVEKSQAPQTPSEEYGLFDNAEPINESSLGPIPF